MPSISPVREKRRRQKVIARMWMFAAGGAALAVIAAFLWLANNAV